MSKITVQKVMKWRERANSADTNDCYTNVSQRSVRVSIISNEVVQCADQHQGLPTVQFVKD